MNTRLSISSGVFALLRDVAGNYDRLLSELVDRQRNRAARAEDPSADSYPTARTPARALAIEAAPSLGCSHATAIRHLEQPAEVRAQGALVEVGALACFEPPLPALTDYHELLDPECAP